jgi:adenylate cyclase class 2
MREIEIKLKVDNLEEIENKLKERSCVISDPINQHDFIYSLKGSRNEFESAKEGDIIIRIRQLDDMAELNLKEQRTGEMDNLEYETEVSDPEATRKILETLGWYPAIEVKKTRKKSKLGEYEICLDNVEKLGTFIELEKLTDDNTDPNEVREELFKELESLGLSRKDEETRGYDTQIYFLEKGQN